jgi:hypothetical protein
MCNILHILKVFLFLNNNLKAGQRYILHHQNDTNKTGQVAKFHTPLPDENPNQIYVVLEIIENDIRPRADIQALDTGLPFPPINTVLLKI